MKLAAAERNICGTGSQLLGHSMSHTYHAGRVSASQVAPQDVARLVTWHVRYARIDAALQRCRVLPTVTTLCCSLYFSGLGQPLAAALTHPRACPHDQRSRLVLQL